MKPYAKRGVLEFGFAPPRDVRRRHARSLRQQGRRDALRSACEESSADIRREVERVERIHGSACDWCSGLLTADECTGGVP